MGDHEDCLIGTGPDADQLILNGAACQRIKRPEGFIKKQQLWLDCKGTGNRDTLSHPSGELGGLPVLCAVRQANKFEIFIGMLPDLFF